MNHDKPLANHFGIEKTRKFVARKYYWATLQHNVQAYIQGCNICRASNTIHHKPYGNLQLLPVSMQRWKNLSIDFVIGLSISTNWKSNSFNSILVIVDRQTKIIHYEPVKVTIDASSIVEAIIDIVVCHHGLSDAIGSNCRSVSISKSRSLLSYFLGIKQKHSTVFYPQSNSWSKRQNGIIFSSLSYWLRSSMLLWGQNWYAASL